MGYDVVGSSPTLFNFKTIRWWNRYTHKTLNFTYIGSNPILIIEESSPPFMPQFKPYIWINIMTWLIVIMSIVLINLHLNKLPNLLKIKLTRLYILFTLPLK